MPKTREQNLARRRETREKILVAALDMFAKRGYHGASICMIARRARVSKGLIYSYFLSKQKIVAVLVERHKKRIEKILDISADLEPKMQLERLLDEFCTIVVQNRQMYRFIFSLLLQPDVERFLSRQRDMGERLSKDLIPRLQAIVRKAGGEMNQHTLEHLRVMAYGEIFEYLWRDDEDAFRKSTRNMLGVILQNNMHVTKRVCGKE